MHIGGTLVSAIVKIAVTAATLALVYFFLLKPVLDTTENVTGGASISVQEAFDSVNEAFDQAGTGAGEAKIKRKIRTSSGGAQDRLLRCVQNAQQDVNRIQRCAERFGP
jgi:hypothetical protein